MLVLGLILILVSAVVLVAALLGGANDTAQLDLGVFSGQTSTMVVFLLGAATLLVFVIGLELTRSGIRRANRRRKKQKEFHRLSERYERDQGETSTDRPPGVE